MGRTATTGAAIAVAVVVLGCTDESGDPEAGTSTTDRPEVPGSAGSTATSDSTATSATSGSTGDADSTDVDGTGTEDSTSSASTTGSGGEPTSDLPHEQDFEGPDGSSWPAPWVEAGTQVTSSELVAGRGRFDANPGHVARMVLPGFSETDVDAVITVEFEDWERQGFGLYVRQNGGVLRQTDPPGQGYAAYVEGGYMRMLGIWRELDGVEEPIANETVPGGELAPGPHRLRFQCFTEGHATRLRARIWPVGEPEPRQWHVEVVDDTPALQRVAGSFAIDLYNYAGTGSVYVDDLRIDAP